MIRPGLTSDLAACLRLGKVAFHRRDDKPTALWFVDLLERPGATLTVCTAPLKLVGFILHYPSDGRNIVRMIATDPEMRRAGIARSLLSTVKGPGSTWIRQENDASQGLFAASGWVRKFQEDGWQRWELE